MPYKPTSSTAQHALDEVQILAAQNQYAWQRGCDVTLTSATGSIESTNTPGAVVFDGELIDIASENHAHPDGDPNDPRWDALVVTDRTGTLEVFTGIPNELVQDPQGNPVRGEPAFSPAPSDTITSEMVCLALVWIPSGATTNDDLTNTSVGGVPNPVIDRRVYQAGQVNQSTQRATITTDGWKTIASQAPLGTGPDTDLNSANGLFTVRDTQTGRYSSTTFWASHQDGEQPTISVVNSSAGSSPRAIQGVRIVTGDSEAENGAEVQINVQLNTNSSVSFVEYTLQNNYHYDGWWPESWQDGIEPSGYNSTDIYWRGSEIVTGVSSDFSATARWSVDRDGNASMHDLNREQVATKVTLSAQQSIPSGTPTAVEFDQTEFDHYGAFTGNTSISVPVDGTYLCDANIGFSSFSSSGVYVRLDIQRNGPFIATTQINPLNDSPVISTNTVAELSAGDLINARVFQNSGSATDLRAQLEETFLYIAKLG